MTELSVKSSIRNFRSNKKLNKDKFLDIVDYTNFSIQLTRIGKMLDESVLKFTKRYLIIQTELEEMKREFVGDISLIHEFLNLLKKEFKNEKYDNFSQGKNYMNINNVPHLPNYEQTAIFKTDQRINKSLHLKRQNLNNSRSSKIIKKTPKNNTERRIITKYQSKSPYQNNLKGKMEEELLNLNNSNYNSLRGVHKNNRLKDKKEILNLIPDNKSKAIYILLNSPILSYEEKLKLLPSKKIISSNVCTSDIFNDALANIKNKINFLKQHPIEEDEKIIIDKVCSYPSKTAITGLNFLNNEKEKELMVDNEQNKRLLEITLICLGEKVKVNSNIKEIYNNLFKKYKVNSIKRLYLNFIYKKIYQDAINGNIELKQIEKIIKCIENNKVLISEALISSTNKTFSYIAFSIDEIYEYLCGLKEMEDDLKEKVNNQLNLKLLIREEEIIRNLIN